MQQPPPNHFTQGPPPNMQHMQQTHHSAQQPHSNSHDASGMPYNNANPSSNMHSMGWNGPAHNNNSQHPPPNGNALAQNITAQIEALNMQQNSLREQIHQSEANLTAQHTVNKIYIMLLYLGICGSVFKVLVS